MFIIIKYTCCAVRAMFTKDTSGVKSRGSDGYCSFWPKHYKYPTLFRESVLSNSLVQYLHAPFPVKTCKRTHSAVYYSEMF